LSHEPLPERDFVCEQPHDLHEVADGRGETDEQFFSRDGGKVGLTFWTKPDAWETRRSRRSGGVSSLLRRGEAVLDRVETIGEELRGRDQTLDGPHQAGLARGPQVAVGCVHEGFVDLLSDLSHRSIVL
jgi:hypothetical protein